MLLQVWGFVKCFFDLFEKNREFEILVNYGEGKLQTGRGCGMMGEI